MRGQDKKRVLDLDQPLNHCERTFHRILDICALEQFIDQHQPFLAIVDLFYGMLDSLHFVKEKALAFGNIVHDVDVAQQAKKYSESHFFCRYTHANMCEKYSGTN